MSCKMQVCIELEPTNHFFFISREDNAFEHPMTMWIESDLYEEWKAAVEKFQEVNRKVEQLYRSQENLNLFDSPPVPKHEFVEGVKRGT